MAEEGYKLCLKLRVDSRLDLEILLKHRCGNILKLSLAYAAKIKPKDESERASMSRVRGWPLINYYSFFSFLFYHLKK